MTLDTLPVWRDRPRQLSFIMTSFFRRAALRRAASFRSLNESACPRTKSSPYPPIAEEAKDLKQLKKTVEDAATVSSGLWLSYLFVLFYLAVATGAVTHVDLFLDRPVKMPFLNIELPLLAFFFLAPILFVITHIYTLVHLVLLTDKAKRFHSELRRQIKGSAGRNGIEKAKDIRNALRRQLPSNIFVQFLAGPEDLRESLFGALLKSIAWATLVVGPILLLLLLQIQFLPYHNKPVTWTHRVALLVDLLGLWWLWRTILSGRGDFHRWQPWTSWVSPTLGIMLTCVVLLFSCAIATFPSEWQETMLPSFRFIEAEDHNDEPVLVSLHQWLFELPVDSQTRRRKSYLSSTLVLTGLNIYEGLNVDDPKKVEWRQFVFLARNRDLRGAVFDLAVMPKIDLRGAELAGASLVDAQLQGTSLDRACLRGASLVKAHLEGASLVEAQLQGASLDAAHLQGAALVRSYLEGTSLSGAELQGASLGAAHLQGASLADAHLEGASLLDAELQGASLDGAHLQGASLVKADLQGASLSYAQLQGASLQEATLRAADFKGALFWRATTATVLDKINISPDTSWAPVILVTRAATEGHFPSTDKVKLPWTEGIYLSLRGKVTLLPQGDFRDLALHRLELLSCKLQDRALASCDPAVPAPPEASSERLRFDVGRAKTEAEFQEVLSQSLKNLVCEGEDYPMYILRGLMSHSRLQATGLGLAPLIDFIMGKDCLAASLTDTDKAGLLAIKDSARARYRL